MSYNNTANMLLTIIIYSGIAGAATILGLLLVLWQEKWTKKISIYVISFAAGVLMTSALLNILPESIKLIGKDPVISGISPYLFILLGFGLFYIIEQMVIIHTCAEEDCATHSFGIVAAIGIGLHSLLDGVAIGLGFEVSRNLGLITSVAVLLHELPEGIFTLGILIHGGMSLRKAVIYTAIVALATPVGAIASWAVSGYIPLYMLGILLSIAAGSFMYIAAADLIPQTHRISRRANVPIAILGGLFIFALSKFIQT